MTLTRREAHELAYQSAHAEMQHPVCRYCPGRIKDGHSRYLHARCAIILRRWVHPTTTREYRLYVPSRTIKRERDLLHKYDAEQKAKEVPADDPGDDARITTQATAPAPGSAPVEGGLARQRRNDDAMLGLRRTSD